MKSESSDDFFEGSGSDWTPLNEIKYDSILAFDSDEENVPPRHQLKKIMNRIYLMLILFRPLLHLQIWKKLTQRLENVSV